MTAAAEPFLELTPERVLAAVEAGGEACNNLCYPLNSFENRVYEVELLDGQRVVAKFYRPGRWSDEQILEEHRFLAEAHTAEIPVAAVRPFPDGSTLKQIDGISYSLAERRGGRAPDELDAETAHRLGMLVGRLHNVGAASEAPGRRPLDAEHFVRRPLAWLVDEELLPAALEARYVRAATAIADTAEPLLRETDTHRVHADLHLGNVLFRDERLLLLDFDDMAPGPPVQDVWLALPGRDETTLRLRESFLSGYESFRLFDRASLRLIEPLRGLRMVRYAVWLARRWDDPAFKAGWPHFGTTAYWEGETRDLEEQVEAMRADTGTAEVGAEALTNKDYFWDWED
jgi:Ser/Thr protein kinase RdoA (MazF antagonist)